MCKQWGLGWIRHRIYFRNHHIMTGCAFLNWTVVWPLGRFVEAVLTFLSMKTVHISVLRNTLLFYVLKQDFKCYKPESCIMAKNSIGNSRQCDVKSLMFIHCESLLYFLFFPLEQTKKALARRDLTTSNSTKGRFPQRACTAQKV